MMDDQDLEARLKAYRPAGPPPALRSRVTEGVARPFESLRVVPSPVEGRRLQPSGGASLAWLPAAAAVLAALMFYWLAAAGRERLFAQFPDGAASPVISVSLESQP